uniref:Uncharacterized protein AlNc14C138G7168 n=1 Tax=Albugo laibachii Nc14 TaxID=890382 RepID=F0WKX8_9STRA|nr:conserved hypothetical protein [Albugo laibachii Nc14]|eukprot:CCA21937.1 conserved hypothetical protein [Albugo laibachii Nc14]
MMASEEIDADGLLSFGKFRPYVSQSIKNVACTDLKAEETQNDGTLLEYYRQRCIEFHQERETFMQHIARIEIEHLGKRILCLEQDLYKQKGQIQALQTENEALQSQEKMDRDKIERLLKISEPILEEVDCMRAFFTCSLREMSPQNSKSVDDTFVQPQIYAYPSTIYIGSAVARTKASKQKKIISNKTISPSQKKSIIHETAQLKHSVQVEDLTQEITVLQQKMEIMKKDFSVREKDANERIQMLTVQLSMNRNKNTQRDEEILQLNQQLEKDLDKANRILHQTTAEYLVLRHNSQENERLALEMLSSLQERCVLLEGKDNQVSILSSKESNSAQEKEDGMQALLQTRESEIEAYKDQIESMEERYRHRIEELQLRLRSLRNRYRSLDTRRRMEMEGFGRDIATLRRHLHKLEVLFYEQHLESRDTKTLQFAETMNANELNEAIGSLRQKFADLATEIVNETNANV